MSAQQLTLAERYEFAVKDAAIVKENSISDQLWIISPNNIDLVWNKDKTQLLVVSWISRADFDQYLNNKTILESDYKVFTLWVTAVPQIRKFCNKINNLSVSEMELRLKQYLGLPHDHSADLFVEMWVTPDSLFRPCVDNEIIDNQCQVSIPEGFLETEYGKYFQHLYFDSFRSQKIAWTGLGYTYDWGNADSKVGASEFILKPGSSYQINVEQRTRKYCSNKL
ncbi:hypothetical protein [Nitrosomonas oligotropha]|nr:hypothetical protein [Nitrosomonas oligotropha]